MNEGPDLEPDENLTPQAEDPREVEAEGYVLGAGSLGTGEVVDPFEATVADTEVPAVGVGVREAGPTRSGRVPPEARVRRAAARTLTRAAERARSAAGRAEETGGAARPAAPLARRAARRLDEAADYVRSHESTEIRDDLETSIRRHPFRALGVAFLAGYITRRIL